MKLFIIWLQSFQQFLKIVILWNEDIIFIVKNLMKILFFFIKLMIIIILYKKNLLEHIQLLEQISLSK